MPAGVIAAVGGAADGAGVAVVLTVAPRSAWRVTGPRRAHPGQTRRRDADLAWGNRRSAFIAWEVGIQIDRRARGGLMW
jgi:hypothetical protein